MVSNLFFHSTRINNQNSYKAFKDSLEQEHIDTNTIIEKIITQENETELTM